ncbi:hypothetical protein PUN28_012542 [Cardiocondyla obscurior]|uniref:Uncharacterized protein n=1 Tax=Cardiocondyla obscurior TaxID=286306 RepID=A0AAW2FBY5_9HYME
MTSSFDNDMSSHDFCSRRSNLTDNHASSCSNFIRMASSLFFFSSSCFRRYSLLALKKA